MRQIQFGRVNRAYATSRNDLPDELFDSLALRGVEFHGRNVADIGAGTGIMSRAMAKRGASVIGVDPSFALLREAEATPSEGRINYVHGFAERTGLPGDTFDLVTVFRAWHWFEREDTLKEIRRLLAARGELLVMDSGFEYNHPLVKTSFAFLREWLPEGTIKPVGSKADAKAQINNFPVEWYEEWQIHGFNLKETYQFPYDVEYTIDDWCKRISSAEWMSTVPKRERTKAIQALQAMLKANFEDTVHIIPHACHVAHLTRQ